MPAKLLRVMFGARRLQSASPPGRAGACPAAYGLVPGGSREPPKPVGGKECALLSNQSIDNWDQLQASASPYEKQTAPGTL